VIENMCEGCLKGFVDVTEEGLVGSWQRRIVVVLEGLRGISC